MVTEGLVPKVGLAHSRGPRCRGCGGMRCRAGIIKRPWCRDEGYWFATRCGDCRKESALVDSLEKDLANECDAFFCKKSVMDYYYEQVI